MDETDDGFPPIPNSNCGSVQFALTVPTIRDRAVMMAAVLVLDPIFEAICHQNSMPIGVAAAHWTQ